MINSFVSVCSTCRGKSNKGGYYWWPLENHLCMWHG